MLEIERFYCITSKEKNYFHCQFHRHILHVAEKLNNGHVTVCLNDVPFAFKSTLQSSMITIGLITHIYPEKMFT